MGLSMFTDGRPVDPGRRIDPATYGTMAVMQPHQITRGLAFRRYAYGKPMQQIADETGLRYDQVMAVLKGQPFSIEVAARLTGYLRTPAGPYARRKRRAEDRSETRMGLMRRLAQMRAIARHFEQPVGFARTDKLSAFNDNELRAYLCNAEDWLKHVILSLYPTIAARWKFPDVMAPWEVLERIDQLKSNRQARDAVAHSRNLAQAQGSRPAAASA